jgi:hypothetical protein
MTLEDRFQLQPSPKNGYYFIDPAPFTRDVCEQYLGERDTIKFRNVEEGGLLSESQANMKPVNLVDLTREERNAFLSFFKNKQQEKVPLGTKWCFLRSEDKYLYAYGGNLTPHGVDEINLNTERQELIKFIENMKDGVDKPPFISWSNFKKSVPFALIGLLALWSFLLTKQFYLDLPDKPPVYPITTLLSPPTPPESISDIDNQPLWSFYHKNFPVVYSWLNDPNASHLQRELAGKIIQYHHIQHLWRHTQQAIWRQISLNNQVATVSTDSEYDKTRIILFDFFNNNQTIHDVWANKDNRTILKDTNFAKLLNTYSTYAYKYKEPEGYVLRNKVFYWQTGNLGLNKPNLDGILRQYHIADDDWERTYDPNKDYVKGSFNFATRFIRVSDQSEEKDKWFIAVYKEHGINSPSDKWTNKITLFKNGEVSVTYEEDFKLLTENVEVIRDDKVSTIQWYSVSNEKANELGFTEANKRTYTENNPVESEVVFTKTSMFVRTGDFIPVQFAHLKVEEPIELIMKDSETAGRPYGFSTDNPITAYVLLNILQEETLRDAHIEEVERRENNILESHIMLAKYVPISASPSIKTFPSEVLDEFKKLDEFIVVRDGQQFSYYNQSRVNFVKPHLFKVERNELKLNVCLPGAEADLPFGTFYMSDKQTGEGCQLSNKP